MGTISIDKFKSGREILSAGKSNMNRSRRGVRGCPQVVRGVKESNYKCGFAGDVCFVSTD